MNKSIRHWARSRCIYVSLAVLLWISLPMIVATEVVAHVPNHGTRIALAVFFPICGVTLLLLGGFLGRACSSEIRDVDINDLLRREPVYLDREAIHEMLRGQRVLVTGAGGSIGSEICRQSVRCHPKSLILVEWSENNLFHIGRELAETSGDVSVVPCIADVGDQLRMHAVFRQHRPQVIFHAAAHKHVPLMEHNPGEALKNNVLGTQRLADLSDCYGVGRFVMISTDKAVNPSSVMGAS
ncbi:MAG TPA: polysaccharide biosynthesis protein, partial [Thermoguttaceae bacterium]|nr:polysaccharide biosynthesis protein [Thermoguttaceae bacterium]